MKILTKHKLLCHCGDVQLELSLPDGLDDPRRCDCSMCRRKGYIVATVPLDGIRVLKGQAVMRMYQFNTMTAKHYFCDNCGIHTHHQRRSNPEQYSFNVGCLEGINPFEIDDIPVYDGTNHMKDGDGTYRIANYSGPNQ